MIKKSIKWKRGEVSKTYSNKTEYWFIFSNCAAKLTIASDLLLF
jgi:hypothetical protein